MPKPIRRAELVGRLRKFGWEGPYQRGKHPFMVKGQVRLPIPNPHRGDIDWSLTKRILQQAGIRVQDWDNA